MNVKPSHREYEHEQWLTCEICAREFAVVHPTVPVGHSDPPQLSVLVPQQTTREHNANQTDTPRPLPYVIEKRPVAAEVQPSLREYIIVLCAYSIFPLS